jgi:hypothetical protein
MTFSRYAIELLARSHLQRLCMPSQYLHVANVPEGYSPDDIAHQFRSAGIGVSDYHGFRSVPTRKQLVCGFRKIS